MKQHDAILASILERIEPLGMVKQPLTDCIGLVLVEDYHAGFDLPMVACSAVDGYAVRSADISSASRLQPVTLAVVSTVRAGILPRREVLSGTAVRIMTGALLPKGADCVVRFEDCNQVIASNGPVGDKLQQAVVISPVAVGDNVRGPGCYSQKGSLIVPRNTVIGPAQLAALAAHGITVLKVIRRPVIAVLSTGDELVRAGRPLSPGKSYDCNATALAALITRYGGTPKLLGIARDNMDSLLSKLRRGMTADAIITSGGGSRGDYDLVRQVLETMGTVLCTTSPMQPGGSFSFGLLNNRLERGAVPQVPLFALAGSPSGCLISFEMLVKPALFRMLGYRSYERASLEAQIMNTVESKRRTSVVKWSRLQTGRDTAQVHLNRPDEYGMFASIAAANALTIIPEQATIHAGDTVQVMPLDWR